MKSSLFLSFNIATKSLYIFLFILLTNLLAFQNISVKTNTSKSDKLNVNNILKSKEIKSESAITNKELINTKSDINSSINKYNNDTNTDTDKETNNSDRIEKYEEPEIVNSFFGTSSNVHNRYYEKSKEKVINNMFENPYLNSNVNVKTYENDNLNQSNVRNFNNNYSSSTTTTNTKNINTNKSLNFYNNEYNTNYKSNYNNINENNITLHKSYLTTSNFDRSNNNVHNDNKITISKSLVATCPCIKTFKCPSCITFPRPNLPPPCTCAPKLSCKKCPPLSLIHEIASKKAMQDQKLAYDLKNLSNNMSNLFKTIGKYANDVLKYELEAKDFSLKMEEAGIKAQFSRQQMEKTSEKARLIAKSSLSPRCENCLPDLDYNNNEYANTFLYDKIFPEEVESIGSFSKDTYNTNSNINSLGINEIHDLNSNYYSDYENSNTDVNNELYKNNNNNNKKLFKTDEDSSNTNNDLESDIDENNIKKIIVSKG